MNEKCPPDESHIWLDMRGRARIDVRRAYPVRGNCSALHVSVRVVAYKGDPRHRWALVRKIESEDPTWLRDTDERLAAIRGAAELAALDLGGIPFRLRSKPR